MGPRLFQIHPGQECDDDDLRGIDGQHSRLFDLVKEFNSTVREMADRNGMLFVLDEIIERARAHFVAEEQMLKELEHASYHFQKTTHRLIIDELVLFRRSLVGGAVIRPVDCIHAMDSLLVHHIKDEPAFYANHTGRVEIQAVAG